MQCDDARAQLGAFLDRELDPHDEAALEAHVSQCAKCQELLEAMQAQDADLSRAFRPQREAARRVAERVVNILQTEPLAEPMPAPPVAPRRGAQWLSLAVAAAGGFLLAVLVFQPWKTNSNVARLPGGELPVDLSSAPAAARLIVATGSVEMRKPGEDRWRALPQLELLSCPSASDIRTGANSRCELETSSGCVIRLNDETEISLASAEAVEIQRGQIWCSAPDNVSLKVTAADSRQPPQPAGEASPWEFACPSNATCLFTAADGDGAMQVTTSDGEIEVRTPKGSHRLKRGETVSIVEGEIASVAPARDPILATGWMHPLLVKKGHENEELAGRVEALLAQMGELKTAMLYEREIRGLGEYAVLPLLRYVQSPQSRGDPRRRQTAMRMLCDMAPGWAVADLISLLEDDDGEIRVEAARALSRLTGTDREFPAERWREDEDRREAIDRWKQWLLENGAIYIRE